MNTKNRVQMVVGVFMTLAILPQVLSLAQACPTKVIFSGARFLGGESFPTGEQVKANLNQEFHTPFSHDVTWIPSDLANFENFVHMIASHYSNDRVVLPLQTDSQQNCTGTLGTNQYSYNAGQGGIVFNLDAEGRDTVFVPLQSHAPVEIFISLPSNCSNCNTQAELFEFDSATISDQ
jgi:hypothetical protein